MGRQLFFLVLLFFQTTYLIAGSDTICGTPLHYQVLTSNEPTDGFFWVAGDRKYNAYLRGADLILEQKRKSELWLIAGAGIYPGQATEVYIDSVYFTNTSENTVKELVIGYSVYHNHTDNHGKSKYIAIIDIRDKILLLNIAVYDHRLERDENGKYIEYIYEADVKLQHDRIVVATSDDSDINDARTQLDDGTYVRHGHCWLSR